MTTSTLAATPFQRPAAALGAAGGKALAIWLFAEVALAFAPLVILGPAIGWPASLGKPAAEQLAGVAAHPDAVRFGYGVYLLYSVLIAPLMIGLAVRVFGGLDRTLPAIVAAFATLSALARSIGILRWLTTMPVLAAAHAAASPEAQGQIELTFDAINGLAGGIGEALGVSLLMAVSLGALAWGAWRDRAMPRALAGFGLVSAVLLAAQLSPLVGGPKLLPVAVPVTAVTLWMLFAGVWCWRSAGR